MRQPNAALVLGLFRRLVASVAQAAIAEAQIQKTRWTVRRYQQRFAHRDGGPQSLQAFILAQASGDGTVKTLTDSAASDSQSVY